MTTKIENLTLLGNLNASGTGNALANVLVGNAGNNTSTGGAGIVTNPLWFRHTGNDLEISIFGTSAKATVQSWYSGSAFHIEQIKTNDSKVLLDTQVEALVQAMAALTLPAMGQTSPTAAQQTALAPVLASSRH